MKYRTAIEEVITAKVGDSIIGDEWKMSKTLLESKFGAGLVVRCPADMFDCPVSVKVTGRTVINETGYGRTFKKVRVELSFINQDDNGNDYVNSFGGWMWINN